MCGINGFTGPQDEALIRAMNEKTAHRGPDGSAFFVEDGISLGHNRLAIIDPFARSDQPMTDRSDRYTIVYNGEIYNFRELKNELASTYQFVTESDTEVIVAGFATWGNEVFKKLNGIFAIALWDKEQKVLTLARDHAGIKPLYVATHRGRVIFSSEIQGLFVHDIPRSVSKEALDLYFRFLFKPGPETLFKSISQIPPGHYGTVAENGTVVVTRFFTPPYTTYPHRVAYHDAVLDVRREVEAAVSRQLISDKPLGLFLSGGLDSTIILALASRERPALDAFTAHYTNLGDPTADEKFNHDTLLAQKTALRFGARHHTVDVSPDEAAMLLEQGVRHLGVPVSSATMIAQLAVARAAKKHVDVVLTGNGGDEVFGGYERYRFAEVARLLDEVPGARFVARGIPSLSKFSDEPGAARIARFMFQNQATIAPLLRLSDGLEDSLTSVKKHLSVFPPHAPFTQKMLWFDRESWLVDHALIRSDRASMAYGVEERVPFLDRALLEVVEPLPLSYKVGLRQTKRILRDAFREEIGTISNEPKRGWFSPGTKWLRRGSVHTLAKEAFSPSYFEGTRDVFLWETLRTRLEDHRTGVHYAMTELWAVLTFQLWARAFNITIE